ncbi:MAG: glycoside hydrolase family 6 protein [Patescibacteria group bacterium]|nr:glycoside hydrolase family 6 protein [Patescibacteria group bacterium]
MLSVMAVAVTGFVASASLSDINEIIPRSSALTVNSINAIWPQDQASVTGQQNFMAEMEGWNLNNYKMFWQVDGDRLNPMDNNWQGVPHKQAQVDLSGWNWKGSGPYLVNFVAQDNNGNKVGEKAVSIYVGNSSISANLDANALSGTSSSCPAPATNAFTGCYYSDQNLNNLALSRTDNSINFDWGGGSPDSKVPSDHFSARWQGNFSFNGGDYTFTATADDGIKVYVDNNLIINQWKDQPASTYAANLSLAPGSHLVKVEYYENAGGALAKVSWQQNNNNPPSGNGLPDGSSGSTTPPANTSSCPSPANNAFTGCYYGDQNLNNLALSRTDNQINFDWGGGSPDFKVPQDQFSARWTGNFTFNAGDYSFNMTSDDGSKLYIDNQPAIDQWSDHAAQTKTITKTLTAGIHNIKMEYYEAYGGAVAKLNWNQVGSGGGLTGNSSGGSAGSNPLAGARFYLNPNSNAKQQADIWRYSRPQDAALMDKIAGQPNAAWFGGWNADVRADVNNLMDAAANQGTVPLLVVYNIPNRDCGGYSAGGINSPDGYRQWIRNLAAGIGSRKAAIILEPDATALTGCLSGTDLQTRYSLLQDAVGVFKSLGQTAVYIDAAHPNWISANDMSGRLRNSGIAQADGFALNVSNFYWIQDDINYGREISNQLGGKHFIIDTSRNGLGPAPDNQWCNPPGRALGDRPTTSTGNVLVDALVWAKDPGGSDGNCNGGPNAGVWWPDYALGLAQRASW